MIKAYMLASQEARETVNLREYGEIITDVIMDTISDYDPVVYVSDDSYFIVPQPNENNMSRIEELLCASELGKYQQPGENLFTVVDIDDDPTKYEW